MFSRTTSLPEKGPRAKRLTRGPNILSGAQNSAPGQEQTKDARWKTVQNAALGIANGAI